MTQPSPSIPQLASVGLLLHSVERTLAVIQQLGIPMQEVSRFTVDADLDLTFDTPHGTICAIERDGRLLGVSGNHTAEEGSPDRVRELTSPADYQALRHPALPLEDLEVPLHREAFLPLATAILGYRRRNAIQVQATLLLLGVVVGGVAVLCGVSLPAGLLLALAAFGVFNLLYTLLSRHAAEPLLRAGQGLGLMDRAWEFPPDLDGGEQLNALLRAHQRHVNAPGGR